MNIYEKLSNVQMEVKAPKGQFNKFGGYSYRSCEDILEALKPVLNKHKLTLVITDEIKNIANRFYIESKVVLINVEKIEEKIEITALAREEETKKGMDGSQITGTASSYARKYALNGLFMIDDTKDDDSNEHNKEKAEREKKQKEEEKREKERIEKERKDKAIKNILSDITDEQESFINSTVKNLEKKSIQDCNLTELKTIYSELSKNLVRIIETKIDDDSKKNWLNTIVKDEFKKEDLKKCELGELKKILKRM